MAWGGDSSRIVQFSRVITPVEEIQTWNATSYGFSFVISYQSRSGPGLQGNPGFVASWRPVYQNRHAVKVVGSPFKTFTAAEQACEYLDGLPVPIEIRPHVRASMAASPADKPRLNVRQPHVVGPVIGYERDRVAAPAVRANRPGSRARRCRTSRQRVSDRL